jgi:hypothetical protein
LKEVSRTEIPFLRKAADMIVGAGSFQSIPSPQVNEPARERLFPKGCRQSPKMGA